MSSKRLGEDGDGAARLAWCSNGWQDIPDPGGILPSHPRVKEWCQLSPSAKVDQVWHALLLFPRAYQRLCAGLLGDGELIDHDPRAATSDPAIRDAR